MGSTLLNVLGDAVCAICVARTEGEFDEETFKQNLVLQENT
jgi:Na+/H+-dicarboxylate symporter